MDRVCGNCKIWVWVLDLPLFSGVTLSVTLTLRFPLVIFEMRIDDFLLTLWLWVGRAVHDWMLGWL